MMDSFNQWLETRARIDLRIADLEDRQAETQRGMVEAQVNLNKARAEYGYLITRDVGITKKQLENDKARFEVQYATISAQIASKEPLQKDAAQLKSREEYLKGEAELNNLYKERFDTLAAIYQIMIEIFNLPSLTWAQAFNKELLNWKDNLNKFYDHMVSTVMVGLKDVVVESINDLILGVDERVPYGFSFPTHATNLYGFAARIDQPAFLGDGAYAAHPRELPVVYIPAQSR